jgi:hypothetical protein
VVKRLNTNGFDPFIRWSESSHPNLKQEKSMSKRRTSSIWKIEKTELVEIVKSATSLAEILRGFGFASLAGDYTTLKKTSQETWCRRGDLNPHALSSN